MTSRSILSSDNKNYLIYLTIITVVVLDQLSKYIIKSTMNLYDSFSVLGDFGVQMQNKVLFTILSVTAAVIVLVYLIRLPKERFIFRFSLALIMGGAIGNLIDRIFVGRVVDFLDVEFFDISLPAFNFWFIDFPGYSMTRWPVFNVADSAVTIGMIFIAWFIVFQKNSAHQQVSA